MSDDRQSQINALQEEIRRNRERFNRQLARDYTGVARRLLRAYNNAVEVIFDRIAEGMSPNSVRDLVQQELQSLERLLAEVAPGLQNAGAESGVRAGIQALNEGGVSVAFNQPTVDAIQSSIFYVDSQPFQDAVRNMAGVHADKVADLIITGGATGLNPREIAALIAPYLQTNRTPLQDALRLARTTMIYAQRQGTRAIYARNGVTHWLWSANLGNPRTCLMCIAMHGTRHPISEVLNDHHNGRCAMTPKTPSWSDLGYVGDDPQIETGVQWFGRQPEAVQRAAMGPGLFAAWQAGDFEFSPDTVVGTYTNPIFGNMRRRRTNQDILATVTN